MLCLQHCFKLHKVFHLLLSTVKTTLSVVNLTFTLQVFVCSHGLLRFARYKGVGVSHNYVYFAMFFLVPVVRLDLHKVLAKCGCKEVACNVFLFFIVQLQLQAVRSLHSSCLKGLCFQCPQFFSF